MAMNDHGHPTPPRSRPAPATPLPPASPPHRHPPEEEVDADDDGLGLRRLVGGRRAGTPPGHGGGSIGARQGGELLKVGRLEGAGRDLRGFRGSNGSGPEDKMGVGRGGVRRQGKSGGGGGMVGKEAAEGGGRGASWLSTLLELHPCFGDNNLEQA